MKRIRTLVLGAVVAVVLSGCDASVYSLPLPGGPDVGENPMTIKVEFADVLDLVPQSTVKVNDVSVGKVTAIDLEGYQALVTLEVRRDVELPGNAVAELRQTSLLGEKFVELSAPEQGAIADPLEDGETIPIERAGRNPEVEEVLGALSLLLNGGGVAQLKTITQELNLALEGREDSARSVLRQLRVFTGQLDENKEDIVDAIESLNRLAIAAEKQLPTIDKALEELPSALDSVNRQRDDLVEMLAALDQLSSVAVDVIARSKDATILSLERLDPVLTQLAASGDDFTNAFHVFLTYPFVDEVVGRDPQVARNLHMGDYTNLSITLDVDLTGIPTTIPTTLPTEACIPLSALPQDGPLPDTSRLCQDALDAINDCLEGLRRGDATDCVGLPGSVLSVVCKQFPVPGLCGGSGTPTLPLPDPTLPTLPIPSLPTITIPGLLRTAPGWSPPDPTRGPTVQQLTDLYDPALVSLLVPGMVER
ncbi:phospholipid/cholesterol/gamma-HCH transport system substrate-binding protein [Nocardioides alpinus]|uniref:Mammalian cell entry protein n=1 Tax=Nocardioides alpinus TaxID=748909 RepID=A0A1I0YUC8_9ACTN|nr:MCE family protein [Nocardioides alpinus]PKH43751.1 mammalian cell entry protein [Nocardioides alpinus]SFB16884.1 phospholipid/cholesterol/gamma-HCH transport system substrate-binding protein [Nocardioides alpinus]